MNNKLFLLIFLICSISLISGCSNPVDYGSPAQNALCREKCVSEGWSHGTALGSIGCNCFNCEQTIYLEDNTTRVIKC